ncbi:MAG: hypothetical protein HWN81_04285 [Candidatus Lokiarchaeota archaeon]|nr:hypothetical protein [Candidatus Lokiarchaeota archaeon]
MFKKGKYRLFSYFIENYLIYYKSIKKNNKIIAFAICEYLEFKSIEPILKDFLRKRAIHYFSIQIDINEKSEKILLLNFEDYKKENIIKSFNIVKQFLAEIEKPVKFLKEKFLEKKFLAIFLQDIKSNTSISKVSEAITISTEKELKFFNFYSINLDLIEQRKSFISNFLNLISNFSRRGFLIFNFQIDDSEEIKIFAYFVDICERNKNNSNIENNVNSIFHSNLISRQNIKIQEIYNYFWRLGVTDTFFFLNDFCNLFFLKKNSYSLDLLNINDQIEENLVKNQTEYVRLSPNLLFIEHNYLFIILENLDSEYIHRILKAHYPKFFIYILILNNLAYKKLLEMDSIKLLENIIIIHPKEIQKLNYQEFKRS